MKKPAKIPGFDKKISGILFVNLATLLWASNIVIGRSIASAIGPLTLSGARFTLAALLFGFLLFRDRSFSLKKHASSSTTLLFLGMALTGVVAFSPLLYLGLRYTTAANAALINGTGPLMTGFLALLLLREPMSFRQITGACVALGGIGLLLSRGSLSFVTEHRINQGDLVVILAVFLWGLYSVLGKKTMRSVSPLVTTAVSTFMGLPFLYALAFLELRHFPVSWSLPLFGAVLYVGLIPAALGFYAWNAGVARLGPSGAMVFYNTLPLYGALLGYLCLGEPLGMLHLAGGALIIGGGLWGSLS
ncbi:MAG TPA: EamA family transporter [Synergistaceae bacterium]|nr:EamA family transporter [Synergistaceae bacterium]HPJ26905.1 EamA family transporter [Synergistaceae bacterium]HPQ37362.1 EamA family transporter [Synergistaceae bacterium]